MPRFLQGRAALDAALAAYASGRADFGTVLGNAEDLLRDARAIEDLRSERLRALALLEPAVGRELLLAAPADPPPLVTDGGLHD